MLAVLTPLSADSPHMSGTGSCQPLLFELSDTSLPLRLPLHYFHPTTPSFGVDGIVIADFRSIYSYQPIDRATALTLTTVPAIPPKRVAAMADPETEVVIPEEDVTAADEEMGEAEENGDDGTAPGGLEDIEPNVPTRTTFLE